PDTFQLYETEVPVAEAVTGLPHVPALAGTRTVVVEHPDGPERWVLLAFAAGDGGCPVMPWGGDDLRAVLDAWARTRAALWDREVPGSDGNLADMLGRWDVIAADPDDPWHRAAAVWAPREAALLEQLRAPGRAAHLDLRADNVLLDRDGRVWFVDWT